MSEGKDVSFNILQDKHTYTRSYPRSHMAALSTIVVLAQLVSPTLITTPLLSADKSITS
jgi:hypothetical protein